VLAVIYRKENSGDSKEGGHNALKISLSANVFFGSAARLILGLLPKVKGSKLLTAL